MIDELLDLRLRNTILQQFVSELRQQNVQLITSKAGELPAWVVEWPLAELEELCHELLRDAQVILSDDEVAEYRRRLREIVGP